MRALRFILGVLLIPVCVAVTQTTLTLVQSLRPESSDLLSPSAIALTGGFLLWVILYLALPRPVRTYVLAHELTHALWGWFMGASVLRMNVSSQKGSVTLSKTNFLITLAPYFFPLYSVLVIAAYGVLSIFFDVQRYQPAWLALVGFAWGFHFTFTISSLMQHQSDILAYGRLLSYTAIYGFNVLGVCLWIVLVSSATLEQMLAGLHHDLVAAGLFLWKESRQAWSWAEKTAAARR